VLTVVLGLLVLSVLVVFHELGHFWMARAMGVRVERFSIGFGPVILSRRHNGVEFALSAFPLGGYVKMGGDDPRQREDLKPGDLFAAPWWRRVLIALAGPGANYVLAVLLSILLLWIGIRVPDAPNRVGVVSAGTAADSLGIRAGDRIVEVDGVPVASLQAVFVELDLGRRGAPPGSGPVALTFESGTERRSITVERGDLPRLFQGMEFPVPAVVGEVVIGTPAYKAGLSVGDQILAVDDRPVENFSDLREAVVQSAGREIVLIVLRDDRQIRIPITPFEDRTGKEPAGKIGIAAASVGTYVVRLGFAEGAVHGARSATVTVGFMIRGIVSLFSDVSNLSQISGPVAIIQASGNAAQAGVDRLLDRAILFSIALMVFNLLPIPILDGGMVVLSVLEGVRGRPIGERGLAVYQGIGIAVMGTLLIFVLINDPLRILQRRSALGRVGDVGP
jgi:regulator of sigma E protease